MSYLDEIADRLEDEDPFVLIWELAEAFEEADRDAPGSLTPEARVLAELVRFCNHDAIAPWLRDERDAVSRALRFAERIGERDVARILAEALDGKPQPKATFSVSMPGKDFVPLEIETPDACWFDGKDWSGTDTALSFAMDGFTEAVLKEVLAARASIRLDAPLAVRKTQVADSAVDSAIAGGETAASFFRRIVGARNPRMAAGSYEDYEERRIDNARRIDVKHAAYPPAPAKLLRSLAARYGSVADDLLAIYAMHNGAELFLVDGEPGFYLAPVEHWEEMLGRAVEWATEVTWAEEEDEIPSYLHTAIAFGMLPGDHERWLLITEGKHAGKILLSDTDVIEDEPRFESPAGFFGTLLLDSARILNCGGHVRYGQDKDGEGVFPIRYEFD